ncbi:hypothetical protein AB0D04_40195 [Streptomyces sp. NPDC048483]|uniref:hypothetical protein n=1 Tax=Streptomyces sp. NPDC048483 TaxID=3154927 RepID=UPI003443F6D2
MLEKDNSLWSDDVWVVDSIPVGCGCMPVLFARSLAVRGMGGVIGQVGQFQ